MQTAAWLRPINILNDFFSTLKFKITAKNKLQFDQLWRFEVSYFMLGGGTANVITRPVRQKPRYATDHLIDNRNLFCTWDNIKLLSTAFPTRKPHICRKQFVIQHIVPYSCRHLPVRLYRAPTRALRQTSIQSSRVSSYSYAEPYFETKKLTRNARRFVGVR